MDTFLLVLAGYIALFVMAVVGMALWNRRKRRKPFREDVRLLRMPGEHLWRKVLEHDENDLMWFFILGGAPIIGIALCLPLLSSVPHPGQEIIATVIILFAFVLCTRAYYKRLQRRANWYLGFFGERYVGDLLEPLKSRGWFIFHDIPCAGGSGRFNMDHVAVGPMGVWVVETKTRSKDRALTGRKRAEVNYDGERVEWPGQPEGDDRPTKQAARCAQWLGEWLEKQLGRSYPVAAVLTAPGYWVNERKLGAVRMVNPNVLPIVLQSRKDMALSPEDIDLIRRQLETKCRDIEY